MNARPAWHLTDGRRSSGFTLPELLVTMVTMVVVMGALVANYLYGLKMVEFTKPKLGASDEARSAISLLVQEIRSAFLIRIGEGNLASFQEAEVNKPQIGNAIQIYPTTNLSSFIRYYWDPADRRLKRTTDALASALVVANSVSNQTVFTAEDFSGRVLTNNYNNRVIGLKLQFYQIQYPVVPIGEGNYYDFYQLRTKITRRTIL